jgi:NhaP-type Na+/H+ or K+/H+ antiporter
VSGPTVVLPMLAFIRPTRDVRSLLKWEGVLVDPSAWVLAEPSASSKPDEAEDVRKAAEAAG